MKIGILTLHRVVNEGSLLQAYCGIKVVRSCFPNAQVEIIDLQSTTCFRTERTKIVSTLPPRFSVKQILKRRRLRNFLESNCVLSPKKLITNSTAEAARFIERQKYDVVVVGSDTIWNCSSPYLMPEPGLFFLSEVNAPVKIGFAASSDRGRISKAPESVRADLSVALTNFDFITVRDRGTFDDLVRSGLDGSDIHYLPDPALLYDLRNEFGGPTSTKVGTTVAALAVSDVALRKRLAVMLIKRGYQVENLLGSPPGRCSGVYINLPVNQRLAQFGAFDLIVTDRFHVAVFGLNIGRCPVVGLEDSTLYPGGELGKIRDLFRRISREEMIWKVGADQYLADDVIERWEMIARRYSWPCIRELEDLRREGRETLKAMKAVILETISRAEIK